MRAGGEKMIYSKIANSLYLKVPKLVNLTNRHSKQFTVISPCKRELQHDQEKITKTKKKSNRNKEKTKLTPKQPVKTNRHKKFCHKKKSLLANKN